MRAAAAATVAPIASEHTDAARPTVAAALQSGGPLGGTCATVRRLAPGSTTVGGSNNAGWIAPITRVAVSVFRTPIASAKARANPSAVCGRSAGSGSNAHEITSSRLAGIPLRTSDNLGGRAWSRDITESLPDRRWKPCSQVMSSKSTSAIAYTSVAGPTLRPPTCSGAM